jgi:SAM-dependent methyltransferase
MRPWLSLFTVMLTLGFIASCNNNKPGATKGAANNAPEVEQSPPATVASPEPELDTPQVHDPAHPPIDCPLRKQGLNPGHLRPFDDVEKYIAFLERADRAIWQKPDEVVAALALTGSETVVDLGAGSGYFTFRLAQALPVGKLIAADTEPEMVRHIHHKAMTDGLQNVEATLIEPEDPEIPGDVLHHVPDRAPWLRRVVMKMQTGARLVLIEFKEGNLPEGPPESMKIPRDKLVQLATDAGLDFASERADLLPYQTFLVFRKP